MEEKFYLAGGNVLDAEHGVWEKKNILIEGGRIRALTDRLDEPAEKVDCSGKYLVPGIIDAHVHLVWDGTSADPMTDTVTNGNYLDFARAVRSALDSLRAGVTTVRDVGCNDDCTLPLANAIRNGVLEGANVIPAGSATQASYGHCPMIGFIANTEAELITRIKKLKAAHVRYQTPPVHWAKIMASGGAAGLEDVGPCQYSQKELEAVTNECHRLNMKLAVHALSYEAIESCVNAGIDTIEHGADLTEELLVRMKQHGQTWVPTVGVYKSLSESRGIIADTLVDKAAVVREKQKAVMKMAREIGTNIILGSDAGSAKFGPHPSAFVEMFTMREYGMPNDEVICSATVKSAEILGIGEDRGSFAVGKYADLDILDADPLEDLHAFTEKLDCVYKEGKKVD